MITLFQGDSSDILVLKDTTGAIISDSNWEAEVSVSELTNGRPIIRKKLAKDLEQNVFYTVLFPSETIKLTPGRYNISFQITNRELGFRREIKDRIKVNKQNVWNNDSEEFSCTLPAKCLYTKDGSIPKEMEFVAWEE